MKTVILAKGLERYFPDKDSFLARESVKVVTAAKNDDVLRDCLTSNVDLLVMTLDLPGISCDDLFSTIRSDPKLQKVSIIVVCPDTLAHRDRCKRYRANAVFTTPVDQHLLSLKMHEFLNVAPRMVYRATLAVAIEGRFQGQPLPFRTENISESGMLIRTAEPLKKGAGVFLSFFLPDGAHVTGYGEIVRVDRLRTGDERYLYGVKFTNIDEESKKSIRTTVGHTRRSKAS